MAGGRIYAATFSGEAETAQVDFFEINAPADGIVEVLSIHLSQSSEVADAAEEQLLVLIKSGQTTSGSGGGSVTPVPRNLGDAAYGGTVEQTNTTKASSGTIVTHHAQAWNVRVPLDIIFTPETTLVIPPSGRLTVELGTTPADSITFAGTIIFKEFG